MTTRTCRETFLAGPTDPVPGFLKEGYKTAMQPSAIIYRVAQGTKKYKYTEHLALVINQTVYTKASARCPSKEGWERGSLHYGRRSHEGLLEYAFAGASLHTGSGNGCNRDSQSLSGRATARLWP